MPSLTARPAPRDRDELILPAGVAIHFDPAFGVSAMAVAVGILFILIGLGIRDVSERVQDVRTQAHVDIA